MMMMAMSKKSGRMFVSIVTFKASKADRRQNHPRRHHHSVASSSLATAVPAQDLTATKEAFASAPMLPATALPRSPRLNGQIATAGGESKNSAADALRGARERPGPTATALLTPVPAATTLVDCLAAGAIGPTGAAGAAGASGAVVAAVLATGLIVSLAKGGSCGRDRGPGKTTTELIIVDEEEDEGRPLALLLTAPLVPFAALPPLPPRTT